jgi:hypothetical protein
MAKYSRHTLLKTIRRYCAHVLMAFYLLIVLSPLAPFAMHSKFVAHTITGVCAGDCRICGCSQESQEAHSCCCAQKKRQQQFAAAKLTAASCCGTKSAINTLTATISHCNASQTLKTSLTDDDSHAGERQEEHLQGDDHRQGRPQHEIVVKCNPCGKGKLFALAGSGSSETLPSTYSERIIIPHESPRFSSLPHQLTSRYVDPPDQPPKLPRNS